MAFDVQAYLAANPDLAANYESGGIMTQLGGSLEDAAAAHWDRTGQQEVAQGLRDPLVVTLPPPPPFQGEIVETPPLSVTLPPPPPPTEVDYAVRAFEGDLRSADAPQGLKVAPPIAPQAVVSNPYLAANPDLAANWNSGGSLRQMGGSLEEAAANHYATTGQYEIAQGLRDPLAVTLPQAAQSPLATPPAGMRYIEPTLMPANEKYSTPYYAAYTNDDDLAGTVMVAPGQKIRLVDGKSGEVVYEGEGPEAAKIATGVANTISQDKGRKASWKIEADTGDGSGWKTQAYERYDPKDSFLGKLADIALPILGAVLGGPLGAMAGSGISSAAQGRPLGQSLLRAGLSGAGAGIGSAVFGGAGGGLIGSSAGDALTNTVGELVVTAGGNAIGSGLGGALTNTVGELVVTAGGNAIGSGLGGALGAGVGSGAGALVGSSGGGPSNQVSELVVEPRKPDQLAVSGGGLAGVPAALGGSGVPNPVDELVVTPERPQTVSGAESLGAFTPDNLMHDPLVNPIPNEIEELVVKPPVNTGPTIVGVPPMVMPSDIVPHVPPAVTPPENPLIAWIKANPALAAMLGLTGLGALTGGGGGGGKYAVPAFNGSLGPQFGGGLPAANPRYTRAPRDMSGVDWNRYAFTPERSFFENVPQGYTVNPPGGL